MTIWKEALYKLKQGWGILVSLPEEVALASVYEHVAARGTIHPLVGVALRYLGGRSAQDLTNFGIIA